MTDIERITSRENARIKRLRTLCESRRARAEEGCFLLEGVRLVADAVKSGRRLTLLLATEAGMARAGDDWPTLAAAADELLLLDESVAQKLADTRTPQGVFALCEGTLTRTGLPDDWAGGALVLVDLQDPGNVGTVLRSADAFGLSAVFLCGDCPDVTSPKVLRASMGAALRLPMFGWDDPAALVDALREQGRRVYAAALSPGSRPVGEVDLAGATVLIGSEAGGLPEPLCARCDASVILPLAPGSESLNAAMAATVFAWELSKGR